MILSDDSKTVILLCSHLGAQSDPTLSPLTTREWNLIARKLQATSLKPADLLLLTPQDRSDLIGDTGLELDRVSLLLQRGGSLAIELERLESLGISVVTRADPSYPAKYRQRLKDSAPALLFYAGDLQLLGQPGIAVVGSRNLDDAGRESAELVGNACGLSGLVLYSGGARGVDTLSMTAALDARGFAVGILADSLERAIRTPETRQAIEQGCLCLATPYSPSAPFSVGNAMGRNRLIYTLADYAIVVASDYEKGGTWAGATEALKAGWIPVFVLGHPAMPEGNKRLIEKGALSFPHPFPEHPSALPAWLAHHTANSASDSEQLALF